MFETLTQATKQIEPTVFRSIHREALSAVGELRSKEWQLILTLHKVDRHLVYRYLGYNSLFQYCVLALQLTESQSMMYISVARKSAKLPVLQEAIAKGEVTVSKVNRIISVLNEENQHHW